MSNVNVITTDSDEFARQAMAYLESKGFKVTKQKFDLPIVVHKHGLMLSRYCTEKEAVDTKIGIAETEISHIKDAYKAGQRNLYSSADEYMKNEYNDFTA